MIFSDESKFNVFGSDGRSFVWRQANTEMEVKNLRVTVKHGGGSIMIWGCMAAGGTGNLVFIDGIMDKYKYLDILKQNLKESARKLDIYEDFYFQQDNDPKHTADIVKNGSYTIPPIRWPHHKAPILTRLNLWAIIGKELQKFNITSKASLKEKILEVWNSISPSVTEKLVNSMHNRLQHVIRAKGGPTKY